VPLPEFFTGVKKTVLAPGEWVLGIELPAWSESPAGRFLKRQRVRGHDLAVVNVAGCVWKEPRKLRLAVGACAPTPLVFELDDLLADGKAAPETRAAAAWARVSATLKPISDNRGSAEYRTDMARLFVTTVVEDLGRRAG
jgi:CO/xanthine dehydrogenase FAD-binding subunit